MITIQQLAQTMQTILNSAADIAAQETRFVQRKSKLTGAKFAQTLVFGWLSNPQATLEELAQTAATLGVEISPQGIDQRFTGAAAACLEQVLGAAVTEMIEAEPVAIPILQRFKGVYILDGSTIGLPAALADEWAGCGNRVPGNEAAVKVQVCLDLITGALWGPLLQDGWAHDRSSPLQTASLPAGALRLADLGYFSLDGFQELDAQGVYWLSRLQVGTAVFDQNGEREDLVSLLRAQREDDVGISVKLGVRHCLSCRLLAKRVPQKVAAQRRRRLRQQARGRGQVVSQARLGADWTIYVTNAPIALMSLREVLVLARARWQIELLFKLWKNQGLIDEWRTWPRRDGIQMIGWFVMVVVSAMKVLVHPRQVGHPRRAAVGIVRIGIREALPLSRQSVHAWRLQQGLARAGHAARVVLISQKEKDVGAFGLRHVRLSPQEFAVGAVDPIAHSRLLIAATVDIGADERLTVPGPMPVAGFTYAADALTATFTNTSTDAVSYQWDFDDGGGGTSEVSPTCKYASDRSYRVTLTSTCAFSCTDTYQDGVEVTLYPIYLPLILRAHQ